MGDNSSDSAQNAELRQLHAKLSDLWTTTSLPSAYSSLNQLYQASRGIKGASRKRVREWLESQPSYTRHKIRRKRFKRRQIISYEIDELWASDLIDVQSLARHNKNYSYLLLCLDGLSGYLWLRPLKRKTGEETAQALQSIFDAPEKRKPRMLLTDRGKEYYNRHVQSLLERRSILLMSTNNPTIKSAQAERAVRVVRSRISRLLEKTKSLRYIDQLDDIVASINASKSRVTGMSPEEIIREGKGKLAFQRRFGPRLRSDRDYENAFKAGDIVRVALPKDIFTKESSARWSRELYRVEKAVPSHPHTYRVSLVDSKGDSIGMIMKGYYSPELSIQRKPLFSLEDVRSRSIPRRRRAI